MINRSPGISRASSSRPQDAVPKVIADQSERLDLARRRKRLLAQIRSSRADFTREFESRRRLLASLKPPPVNDPLVVEIEKQWTRLSSDFHKYRTVNHYPGRKWRHGSR